MSAVKNALAYTEAFMADLDAPWTKKLWRGSYHPIRLGRLWTGHQWVHTSRTGRSPLPEATWAIHPNTAFQRANGNWVGGLCTSELVAITGILKAFLGLGLGRVK